MQSNPYHINETMKQLDKNNEEMIQVCAYHTYIFKLWLAVIISTCDTNSEKNE